jgi:lipopolysaccharide export system protein LptA
MKRAALFFAMLYAAAPASAADAPPTSGAKTNSLLGQRNTNQPIDVHADKFSADLNAKTFTYSGNVIVIQGDIRMHAADVKVNTADGKAPTTIVATGGVVVDSPGSGTATGDAGTYDVPNHLVTLTGRKVVLVHNKDISSGTKLTVNLVTNVATFVSDKSQGGNGRVQGTFTPTGGN